MNLRSPLAGIAIAIAANASAQNIKTITFDELDQNFVHGSQLAGNEYASDGVLISVRSNGSHNVGTTFDTLATRTADSDLEAPFIGGNLAGRTDLGNALIIAENRYDGNNDGILDSPDDEARGGAVRFDFLTPADSFGFSLYDTPESSSEMGLTMIFEDGLGGRVVMTLDDLNARNPSASYGDHFANSYVPFDLASTGLSQFDSVTINLAGSGAIDSVTYSTPGVVPEPSSAVLGLGSLLLVCFRRRR